jgi:hypothetical protein
MSSLESLLLTSERHALVAEKVLNDLRAAERALIRG